MYTVVGFDNSVKDDNNHKEEKKPDEKGCPAGDCDMHNFNYMLFDRLM